MFKQDSVSCAVCKHLVLRKDANVVQVINSSFAQMTERYYCPTDAPPYEKVRVLFGKVDYNYFKEFEVNEKGVPIGYKKI